MRKFEILIVDDHREWCDLLKKRLEQYSFFDVAPPLYDGEAALQYIEEHKPDVIILDLIMPVCDGLYVITYIRERMAQYDPFIYVLSAIGVQKTNKILSQLDVDYYSVKPIRPKAVADNLYKLLLDSEGIRRLFPDDSDTPEEERVQGRVIKYPTRDVDVLIEDYLYEMGAAINLISTKHTRLVIKHCMADHTGTERIMELYRKAADELIPAVSPGSVERNLRSTIASIDKKGNSAYRTLFPKRPNNSQFVFMSARIIRQRMGVYAND